MLRRIRTLGNLIIDADSFGIYVRLDGYNILQHTHLSWKEVRKLVKDFTIEDGPMAMEFVSTNDVNGVNMEDLDTEKIILKTIGKLSEELLKNKNDCAQMSEEIKKMEEEIEKMDKEIKKNDKVIACETDKLLKSGNMMVKILDGIILTNTYIVATQIYRDEVYANAKRHRNSIINYINMFEKNVDDIYSIASLKSEIYGARMFVVDVLR